MKQVKILLCQHDLDIDDEYYTKNYLIDSISDWEEISDEDFLFLKENFDKIRRYGENDFESDFYGFRPILIIKDPVSINQRIRCIKDMIDEARKKQEQRELKKIEREKKRQEKDEENKKKQELKLLKSLKEKYGD